METLFGDGSGGLKVLIALVAVLVLLAVAFWLVRRFGGGRLGGGATRGRQPRLAVIDQAAVDGRRRLVLIRRDNVEHLLIIGGPTDVVVEQNILRAAARETAPVRPAAAPDALPRAVPLGDDTVWPLQPEAAQKADSAPRVEPMAPRLEPSPREGGPPEPTISAPTVSPPSAAPVPPVIAPAARERRRAGDALAGLADELSRMPGAPEPAAGETRTAARRPPWLQPSAPAASGAPSGADAPAAQPADPNLSEMAQRLEAALRRPPKPSDKPAEKAGDKPADKPAEKASDKMGETLPSGAGAPVPPDAADEFAPPPRPSRFEAAFRRPFRADDLRAASPAAKPSPGEAAGESAAAPAPRPDPMLRRPFKADDLRSAPPVPKPANEPAAPAGEEGSPATDGTPGKPQKSLYESLEQEMASLLNRPKP